MKKRFRESAADATGEGSGDEGEGVAGLGPDDSMLERMMARSLAADEEEEEEKEEAAAAELRVARPVVASGRSSMLGARADEAGGRSSMLAPMQAAREEMRMPADGLLPTPPPLPAALADELLSPPPLASMLAAEPVKREEQPPAITSINNDDDDKKSVVADEEDEDKFLGAAKEDAEGVPVIELFCRCQKPWNPNHFMVACDDCNEWYHDACLGRTQEELEKYDRYVCPWCVEKRKRKEARKKKWLEDRAAKEAAKRMRQAQRKREEQQAQRKARSKPCKNATCTARARLNSKYCSDECGIQVAVAAHRDAEEKRILESVRDSVERQERKRAEWMQAHPDFLDTAVRSLSTTADLELISEAEEQLAELDKELNEAKASVVSAQQCAADAAKIKASSGADASESSSSIRLDCAVCGRDVPATSYIGHLRTCIDRHEEFSHSTVAQNPSLCNQLSKATDRYCSMPKGECVFHTEGLKLDYQNVACGHQSAGSEPCMVPAAQCFKHADWRHVLIQGAKNRVSNLETRMGYWKQRAEHAKVRIASREMYSSSREQQQ